MLFKPKTHENELSESTNKTSRAVWSKRKDEVPVLFKGESSQPESEPRAPDELAPLKPSPHLRIQPSLPSVPSHPKEQEGPDPSHLSNGGRRGGGDWASDEGEERDGGGGDYAGDGGRRTEASGTHTGSPTLFLGTAAVLLLAAN